MVSNVAATDQGRDIGRLTRVTVVRIQPSMLVSRFQVHP